MADESIRVKISPSAGGAQRERLTASSPSSSFVSDKLGGTRTAAPAAFAAPGPAHAPK